MNSYRVTVSGLWDRIVIHEKAAAEKRRQVQAGRIKQGDPFKLSVEASDHQEIADDLRKLIGYWKDEIG